METDRKLIAVTGPSGAGKSTLVKHLFSVRNDLEFSVSATSRLPRKGEVDGREYYFLTSDEFKKKIENNEFLEWQEVYPGRFYGTLKSEVERISRKGRIAVFDIEVLGAMNLKKEFGDDVLVVFTAPPSLEILEDRLRARKSETEEDIKRRMERVKMEMDFQDKCDVVIVNDDLNSSRRKIEESFNAFMQK